MRCVLTFVVASMLVLPQVGCTLFPDQQPAPLKMTTSAERTNQIFWDDVAKAKWDDVRSLLGGELTWSFSGAPVSDAAAVIAALQGSGIRSVAITDAQVRESGDTVVVTYSLQTNTGAHRMMSVWQRLPGKKAPEPFQLIALAQLS